MMLTQNRIKNTAVINSNVTIASCPVGLVPQKKCVWASQTPNLSFHKQFFFASMTEQVFTGIKNNFLGYLQRQNICQYNCLMIFKQTLQYENGGQLSEFQLFNTGHCQIINQKSNKASGEKKSSKSGFIHIWRQFPIPDFF